MRNLTTLFLVTAVLVSGCDDDDDITDIGGGLGETFSITLSPDEEVPFCASSRPDATGAAVVTISDDGSSVTLNSLEFSGLSSTATAAHIHAGAPGVAGPIVFPLGENPVSPVTGLTFTAADYPNPAPEGAPADYNTFVDAMIAGDTYINVHSEACPTGEIRGQLL